MYTPVPGTPGRKVRRPQQPRLARSNRRCRAYPRCDCRTSSRRCRSGTARRPHSGVMPKPAAEFSPFAITTSIPCDDRMSARWSATITRPAWPKMSPMKRVDLRNKVGRGGSAFPNGDCNAIEDFHARRRFGAAWHFRKCHYISHAHRNRFRRHLHRLRGPSRRRPARILQAALESRSPPPA
jgi:hypothetical protein